jgi:RalA-binding protein 1
MLAIVVLFFPENILVQMERVQTRGVFNMQSPPPRSASKDALQSMDAPPPPPKDVLIAPPRHRVVKIVHGPVFGASIEAIYTRPKPLFFESCIQFLDENALTLEGIYRISGSHALIQQVQRMADKGQEIDFTALDPYTVASVLKLWIRELPEPLLTERLISQFLSSDDLDDLANLIWQLPNPNKNALKILMFHLNRVAAHSKENKMTLSNLEVVFSPTIGFGSSLFITMVEECKYLFRPESDLMDYYL